MQWDRLIGWFRSRRTASGETWRQDTRSSTTRAPTTSSRCVCRASTTTPSTTLPSSRAMRAARGLCAPLSSLCLPRSLASSHLPITNSTDMLPSMLDRRQTDRVSLHWPRLLPFITHCFHAACIVQSQWNGNLLLRRVWLKKACSCPQSWHLVGFHTLEIDIWLIFNPRWATVMTNMQKRRSTVSW